MMMMPSRKKAVTLIVSGMKPDFEHKSGDRSPSVSPFKEDEEDDYSLAYKDASRKILSAIERKDLDDLATYMKEFVYMCQEDQESEEM